jgi:hypothetical protein
MNLLCPNCQKLLTVPEHHAGQEMKCPTCGNLFQVPNLPAAPTMTPIGLPDEIPLTPEPVAPPAAPPINEPTGNEETIYRFHPEDPKPQAPPPTVAPKPERPARPAPPVEEPPPPPPEPPPAVTPSGYQRTYTLTVRPNAVAWTVPIALAVVFILLFFTWSYRVRLDKGLVGVGAWSIAGEPGNGLLTTYIVFTIIALVLVWAIRVLTLGRFVPRLPQPVLRVWPWRLLASVILVGISFLLMLIEGLMGVWTISFWLCFLSQTVALVAALLQLWLDKRGPSLPPPQVLVHW